VTPIISRKHSGASSAKRRKAGGSLSHTIHTLKKVAWLPSQYRTAVLEALKKKARKRQGVEGLHCTKDVGNEGVYKEVISSASVKNDWKHWVVLHENEKVAREDVKGLGEAISVNFVGNSNDMFSVI